MKKIALLTLFLVSACFAFAQEGSPAEGWKPGMTKAEYEAWKQKNIARLRLVQAMQGDIGQIEDLKNGVYYFPFTGKKFAFVLSQFSQKIMGEYDIAAAVSITERKSVLIHNGHGAEFNIEHEEVVGYVVAIRLKPQSTQAQSSPDK